MSFKLYSPLLLRSRKLITFVNAYKIYFAHTLAFVALLFFIVFLVLDLKFLVRMPQFLVRMFK